MWLILWLLGGDDVFGRDRYRPTCGQARLQRGGLALRPTGCRRARHARVSRRGGVTVEC